ncbi:MAG: hypothetical protein SGBAC_002063 [Bacillariaceae sp.]
MEAGRDMSETNSPEGRDPHEKQDETLEVANTFDLTNDEEATVQTENRENVCYNPRHPEDLAQPYTNALYYRPNVDWRPQSRSYYSNWYHYPLHGYPPPPAPPLREGDTFPPYAVRPPHAHRTANAHQQQQNSESEDPPSPPNYRSTLSHHSYNYGFPRQLRWPEVSPHGNYTYHPSQPMTLQENSDTSQGSQTPRSQQEDSTEFSGRRFIPTDIPPPPAVYLHPQPAMAPAPLSPRPSTQTLTRAPTRASTRAPDSPGVKKRKFLHPGSKGVYYWETYDCDILCGRGVPTRHQWGNKHFKELVSERQVEYLACERNDKSRLSNEIIDLIRSYNGRFLRRVKVPARMEKFAWVELTDQRAYEKVCQALRDGGPRIREAMKAMASNERGTRASAEKENVANCPHEYILQVMR